jgi:hypothetical protein
MEPQVQRWLQPLRGRRRQQQWSPHAWGVCPACQLGIQTGVQHRHRPKLTHMHCCSGWHLVQQRMQGRATLQVRLPLLLL